MNEKFSFIVPENKTECEYVGFNFEKGDMSFVFPCQYFGNQNDISDDTKRHEAKKLLTILKQVQQEYFLTENSSQYSQFQSMMWLIQDYVDNGYYIETEKICTPNANGKINWKKSLKQKEFWFNDGNIIYKNFVREKNQINDSQILSQIYKSCLEYSTKRLGFIFGITNTEKSIFDIENEDKDFILHYLNKELQATFNDYKKTLIKHLISIINNQNSKDRNLGFSMFDKEFEYVFEFLINKVFGTEDVKDFYNEYYYHIGDETFKSSKLRPDTIIKDKTDSNSYYIVDAKYYNYGYTKNKKDLPQSSSISKQIGYNHYLKDSIKDSTNIKSIFMLPYSSTSGECLKFIGFASRDQNEYQQKIDDIDKVFVFLVDLRELINAYMYGSDKLSTGKLIESVEKVVSEND